MILMEKRWVHKRMKKGRFSLNLKDGAVWHKLEKKRAWSINRSMLSKSTWTVSMVSFSIIRLLQNITSSMERFRPIRPVIKKTEGFFVITIPG